MKGEYAAGSVYLEVIHAPPTISITYSIEDLLSWTKVVAQHYFSVV